MEDYTDGTRIEPDETYQIGLQFFPAGELTIGGIEPSRFVGPVTYAPRLPRHVTHLMPSCHRDIIIDAAECVLCLLPFV